MSIKNIFYTLGISAVIIIIIEFVQLATGLGSADIDDFILNMISCIIGYVLYIIYVKFFEKTIWKIHSLWFN